MESTKPPGRRHADCQFVGHAEKLEEYWQRHLKELDDRLEEHRRQTLQLFQQVSAHVRVNRDITEHLRDRVDEGFRDLATQSSQQELELRRWMDIRFGSIESRDAAQDSRIQEIAGRAGSHSSMKVSSIVASLVVGVVLAAQQLVHLLQ
jgi:hypothetical protein